MELSERLLNLLGQPVRGILIEDLIREIGVPEVLDEEGKPLRVLIFPKLGFSLGANKDVGSFDRLTFHIRTSAVKSKSVLPYRGILPFLVSPSDTRDNVEAKFEARPIPPKRQSRVDSTQFYWEYYGVGPFQLTFGFDSSDAPMNLCVVTKKQSERSASA